MKCSHRLVSASGEQRKWLGSCLNVMEKVKIEKEERERGEINMLDVTGLRHLLRR